MRYQRIMNSEKTRRAFREYIQGKRVVFCGPAANMKGRGLGSFIDSFDVVVRTNHFPVIIQEDSELIEDVGKRTDILYINFDYYRNKRPLPYEIYKAISLKWICLKRCSPSEYSVLKRFCKPRLIKKEDIHVRKYAKIPLMGMTVAYDILKNEPAELHFTGIDFYNGVDTVKGSNPETYQSYIKTDYIIEEVKARNSERGLGEGVGHDMIENAMYFRGLLDDGKITVPDFVESRLNEVLS